jgi:hypothetical protein
MDRAIAQVVSRWLPTLTAWVQSKVRSCGICGWQSGTGAGFLWVLWFHFPVLIPLTAPHSLVILLSRVGTIDQLVANVQSKVDSVSPHPTSPQKLNWKRDIHPYVCMCSDNWGPEDYLKIDVAGSLYAGRRIGLHICDERICMFS